MQLIFCMLTLYSAILLNSLISTKFSMESLVDFHTMLGAVPSFIFNFWKYLQSIVVNSSINIW